MESRGLGGGQTEEERGAFCDPRPQIPVAWDDAASILHFVQLLCEKPSYTYVSSYCFGSFSTLQITLLCSTEEDSHIHPTCENLYVPSINRKEKCRRSRGTLDERVKKRCEILELGHILTKAFKTVSKLRVSCLSR